MLISGSTKDFGVDDSAELRCFDGGCTNEEAWSSNPNTYKVKKKHIRYKRTTYGTKKKTNGVLVNNSREIRLSDMKDTDQLVNMWGPYKIHLIKIHYN